MTDYSHITIDGIINRYLVRYSRLSGAIPYAFQNCSADKLNIYVDLYGLYRTIYSRSYRTNITNYLEFTSSVVKLCGHYREFFKRCRIRTKIFLVSSFNTPECIKSMLPEYNKTMDDKRQNKVIADMMDFNFSLLDLICPYLPDIFFIKTEFESSVIMYEIMNREQSPSLIISTDLYPIQLCSLVPNTALIWPRWSRNGRGEMEDISPICPPYDHSEFIKSFFYVIHRTNGKTTSEKNGGLVTPSNFMLLEALNQFKDRDLKVILNVTQASKIINKVTTSTGADKLFPADLMNELNGHIDNSIFELIQTRYRALDLNWQYQIFKNSPENYALHYENLTDPDALDKINSKYFAKNPLDLIRL